VVGKDVWLMQAASAPCIGHWVLGCLFLIYICGPVAQWLSASVMGIVGGRGFKPCGGHYFFGCNYINLAFNVDSGSGVDRIEAGVLQLYAS
jgi:hypothetical protein